MSGITLDAAEQQAKALTQAAADSTVRQVRYDMRRRGREWTSAVAALRAVEEIGDEAVIELAGSRRAWTCSTSMRSGIGRR